MAPPEHSEPFLLERLLPKDLKAADIVAICQTAQSHSTCEALDDWSLIKNSFFLMTGISHIELAEQPRDIN